MLGEVCNFAFAVQLRLQPELPYFLRLQPDKCFYYTNSTIASLNAKHSFLSFIRNRIAIFIIFWKTLQQRVRSEKTNSISDGVPFKRSRGTRQKCVHTVSLLWLLSVTTESDKK